MESSWRGKALREHLGRDRGGFTANELVQLRRRVPRLKEENLLGRRGEELRCLGCHV